MRFGRDERGAAMVGHDGHQATTSLDGQRRTASAPVPDLCHRRLDGFTGTEQQRLIFLRWLYRRGRLTEFPDR